MTETNKVEKIEEWIMEKSNDIEKKRVKPLSCFGISMRNKN